MKNLELKESLAFQAYDLALWKTVLKTSVFVELTNKVLTSNEGVTDPYKITRGDGIKYMVIGMMTDKLRTKLEGKVKSTKTQRKLVKKALDILSSDDLSDSKVLELIGKIRDNENQDLLIDYIEGVQVWEKVELEFTCKQFLEEIGYK